MVGGGWWVGGGGGAAGQAFWEHRRRRAAPSRGEACCGGWPRPRSLLHSARGRLQPNPTGQLSVASVVQATRQATRTTGILPSMQHPKNPQHMQRPQNQQDARRQQQGHVCTHPGRQLGLVMLRQVFQQPVRPQELQGHRVQQAATRGAGVGRPVVSCQLAWVWFGWGAVEAWETSQE